MAFLSTSLSLEPSYLAQLCTYTGAIYRKEVIYLSIIFLKIWIFKNFQFYTILHFGSFGISAKDTKFINGTHTYTHTQRNTDIHRHMHTQTHRDRYTTNLHMCQHSDKCIHTNTHMYRGTDTQIQIHTDICMFAHIHTYAHRCICGKSKEIVTSNPLLIQNWPKLLL